MTTKRLPSATGVQGGAVAIEFALVSILFMALVIAVVEFAHVMYVYSTAVEATRLGARVAAVCSVSDVDRVKAKMQTLLPLLQPGNIVITYPSSSCSAATCDPITVSIQNLTVTASIPLVPLTLPVPDFSTSVPSESLDSTNNPLCS